MPGNTSRPEIKRRVDEIMELIAAGFQRKQILQHVAEKAKWKASERTIDNYIKQAEEKFALEAGFNRDKEIGKAKRRLEMMYAASVKVQDFARGIAAVRELNHLLGLPEPVKRELKISGDAEVSLALLLSELEKRNLDASAVFNSILAKLDQEKAKSSHD